MVPKIIQIKLNILKTCNKLLSAIFHMGFTFSSFCICLYQFRSVLTLDLLKFLFVWL